MSEKPPPAYDEIYGSNAEPTAPPLPPSYRNQGP